ncbi:MAG TPA: 1-acyl-sn-glycerol-3-phosphate acyltransferase [Actinobacteria bacterium]|nr:1-acyl-sn-glycerol-3-phosphate acyltransferase [Actinomycetota bacterium]
MLYTVVGMVFSVLFKVLYRLRILGKENIPKSDPVILVANHASYLDPIVLGLAAYPRRVCFMAKEELFRMPILSYLIGRLHAFPVQRGKPNKSAYKTALRLLSEGKVLGLFPEGTRYHLGPGRLGPGEPGAALVALRSSAPVVPVAILGTDRVLTPRRILPRFSRIKVVVGKPFFAGAKEGSKRENLARVTDQIMSSILDLMGEVK